MMPLTGMTKVALLAQIHKVKQCLISIISASSDGQCSNLINENREAGVLCADKNTVNHFSFMKRLSPPCVNIYKYIKRLAVNNQYLGSTLTEVL